MEYNLNAMDAWKAMRDGRKIQHNSWPTDQWLAGNAPVIQIHDQDKNLVCLTDLVYWFMGDGNYTGWGILEDRDSFCGEKE